jgi:hypothetical protein
MPGAKSQVRPESTGQVPPRWALYLAENPPTTILLRSASPAGAKPVITLFG